MPYTSRQGLTNQIEIWSYPEWSLTVTSVASDQTMTNTISVPTASTLRGAIQSAYLDMYCNAVRETSHGANRLDGSQYIKINTGGADQTAIGLFTPLFYLLADDSGQSWWSFGTHDISGYISKGDTITIKWIDSKALSSSLAFYGIQFRLRIYQVLTGA